MTKHSGHSHPHHDNPALSAEAPDMTLLKIDPVCGMTVNPKTTTLKAEHGGQTYYFCSAGCRTKFTANPAKYLDPELIRAAAAAQPKVPSIPAPCIRRSGKSDQAHARSAAWRWSR